jgi:hypothetical protein
MANRVQEIYKLRLGGASFPDIRGFAAAPEQDWGVSDTTLWRYIRAADELFEHYFDVKAKHYVALHLARRSQIFAHAMAAGDFRTALAASADEAKLLGLYPPTKIAPTDPTGTKPYDGTFTDTDRAAALARLHAAVGARNGATPPDRPAGSDGPLLG